MQSTENGSRTAAARFAAALGWNRASYVLLSGFVITLGLMSYIWWPLAVEYLGYVDWDGAWWLYIDWLLIGIFLFMSLMLMFGADLKADIPLVGVGIVGGLVIESWGTQTELWTYYTLERPPLWIIPAWPIASMTIERMVRLANRALPPDGERYYRLLYWLLLPLFVVLMFQFVAPTFSSPFTITALVLCILLTMTPVNYRITVLTFLMGVGLGYFLELWGTTRLCWTYYTAEMPPTFAVLAHGMAAVAFWRALLLAQLVWGDFRGRLLSRFQRA